MMDESPEAQRKPNPNWVGNRSTGAPPTTVVPPQEEIAARERGRGSVASERSVDDILDELEGVFE